MAEPQSSTQLDPKLTTLLQCREDESQKVLSEILSDTVEPVVKNVVRRRLGVFLNRSSEWAPERDAEDLCSEITLNVLIKLQDWKNGSSDASIKDLPGFVANIAHKRCSDYFRSKHPERWRLKTRLRYLLSHHEDFKIYEDPNGSWICELMTVSIPERLVNRSEAETILANFQVRKASIKADLKEIVRAVFESARKPIELDMLVMICSNLTGITQKEMPADSDGREVASTEQTVLDRMVQRKYLETLWSEIKELPEPQRHALLLNLRDSEGNSILSLIPSAGAASIEEIAQVMEMSVEQLLELWNQLPLEDSVIAERIGKTRQQVINLRKSARERLARRMNREKQ